MEEGHEERREGGGKEISAGGRWEWRKDVRKGGREGTVDKERNLTFLSPTTIFWLCSMKFFSAVVVLKRIKFKGRYKHARFKLKRPFFCRSAPEVILDGHYTHASDVWAFAILAWELYTSYQIGQYGRKLSVPYHGLYNHEVGSACATACQVTSVKPKFIFASYHINHSLTINSQSSIERSLLFKNG